MRTDLRPLALRLMAALCVLASLDVRADAIDRYVQLQMERQHIPGLSLAVIQKGRVVKMRGYGFADVERKVPVTPDTVFEIGSISKPFTATAMMILVEKNLVGLEDPIGRYLTGIPDAWKSVTVAQLLSHTSGIADYEEIMGYGAYRNPMTAAQVIALAAAKPLDFVPGSKWNYSNTGYYLLSMIIESVSREPLSQFLRRQVLEPAGMTATRDSDPFAIIPQRSAGYEYKNKQLENRDPIQPSATSGAGMLVSTTRDMVKWDAVLARQAILSAASHARMGSDVPLTNGQASGYGYGWFVSTMRDHRTLHHSGGTAGFTSNFLRLPDDQVTVIVLTNAYNANPVGISSNIARRFVPALAYAPIPSRDPEIGEKVMDYFVHRRDQDAYVKPLSPELAARAKSYWHEGLDYFNSLGPPRSIVLVERRETEANRQYRYRVRYDHASRLVLATIDPSGQIADLDSEEE